MRGGGGAEGERCPQGSTVGPSVTSTQGEQGHPSRASRARREPQHPPERPLPGLNIPKAVKYLAPSPHPAPAHTLSEPPETLSSGSSFGRGSWHVVEPFWKHLAGSDGSKMSETYFPDEGKNGRNQGDSQPGLPAQTPRVCTERLRSLTERRRRHPALPGTRGCRPRQPA